jgi:hypothetical protein
VFGAILFAVQVTRKKNSLVGVSSVLVILNRWPSIDGFMLVRGQIEKVPEEVIFDHLHATAFQRSPLGRTILGPAENVRNITRQQLADYIATNYTAQRMVCPTTCQMSTLSCKCIWMCSQPPGATNASVILVFVFSSQPNACIATTY